MSEKNENMAPDSKKNSSPGEFMNIAKYASKKGVDVHIINGYISAHRDEFKGHIAKDKNAAALDSYAREKMDAYLQNRPDKGPRFHRFDRKEEEMTMKPDVKEETIYSDTEQGVDVPDTHDGYDDRDSISSSKPSRNIHKGVVGKAKHYKVAKQKNSIEKELERIEKRLDDLKESIRLDIKALEMDAPGREK